MLKLVLSPLLYALIVSLLDILPQCLTLRLIIRCLSQSTQASNSLYLHILHSKPITLDQMIHHCQAVKRGAPNRPLLVGDMPFGSYEFKDVDVALKNAYRMVKEGGMDAVKFEVCFG